MPRASVHVHAVTGKKRRPASTDIMSAIRCTDVHFVSFLEGCLRWDHAERFTPEDGLQHEWILEVTTPCRKREPGGATPHHPALLGLPLCTPDCATHSGRAAEAAHGPVGGRLRCGREGPRRSRQLCNFPHQATTPTPPATGQPSARCGARRQGGGLSHRDRAVGAEQSYEHAGACGIGYSAAMSAAAPPLYSPRQPTGHYTQGHHSSLLPRIGGGVRAKGNF